MVKVLHSSRTNASSRILIVLIAVAVIMCSITAISFSGILKEQLRVSSISDLQINLWIFSIA